MQCGHCLSAERLRRPLNQADDSIELADRKSQLACATCGAPLVPLGTLRERVIAKLAVLTRFGLTDQAGPLLGLGRRHG